MSQNDFVIANQAGAAFRADVNSALQALASLSSGATAPSTTYAYMPWYDTTAGVLKIRNSANNAWVIIGPLADSTQHVIYVNNLAKVYINSSGQMGVGVPSPGYAVDVSGDVNVTGNFKIAGANIPTSTKFYACGSVGGTASAITATASPTITAYAADQAFIVKIATTSTATAPTINITSLGAKTIKKQIGLSVVALAPGDLQANTYAILIYDGTDMILTNPRTYSQGADIASAGTVNLDTATGDYVNVTGTTAITAITLSQGREVTVKFAGALTLTNGASLIVPGGANITTAAGDVAVFRGEASSVVRVVSYTKANGTSVVSNGWVLATPQNTTSGTTIDFTGIPSTAKAIMVNFDSVSISGNNSILIQLGDSGGAETTGYTAASSGLSTGVSSLQSTSGFIIAGTVSGNAYSGAVMFTLLDSSTNSWAAHGCVVIDGSAFTVTVSGEKALSATLDRIRLIASNGTDTFDNGKANIAYQ